MLDRHIILRGGLPVFTAKFLDGSPVPPEYQAAVTAMIENACEAQDRLTLDELEAAADRAEGQAR